MAVLNLPLSGPRRPPEQHSSDTSEDSKLVKPWKLPRQKTYLFTHASVVDPVKGVIIPNTTVKIADGIIASMTPSSDSEHDIINNEKDGMTVVDLSGKYLSPGLIDAHVHLTSVPGSASLQDSFATDSTTLTLRQPYATTQTLLRGFTTVRDCGGASLELKEAIADGVFPGPRLFIANHALSQTGGHGDRRGPHDHHSQATAGLSVVCDGVPDCIRSAREQLRTGADFLKIMVGGGVASPSDRLEHVQFTADEIRAICDVARSYGTWVTAHAYTPAAIRHAVDNGVTGIEHGNFIDADTAAYMKERNVWLTPTLITYQAMASDRWAGFLPRENADKNRQVLARGLESLEIAASAGLNMCYGSDLLGPMTVEELGEFAIRRKVLSNVDILRAATVNPAHMLRQGHFLGQVVQRFAADLLIVNQNPLEDVTVFDRPDQSVLAVIKDGRIYHSRWSKLPPDVQQVTTLIE